MLSNYIKNGYILVENLFSKQVVEKIYNDIINVFSMQGASDESSIISLFEQDFEKFHGCAMACQNLISLTELSVSHTMTNTLHSLGLKFPSINTRPLLSFSSKKTAKNESNWKVPAHQDWPSVQGSLNGLTCWMPLVDVDHTLGPLQVLPESHWLGYREHVINSVPILPEINDGFIEMPMKIGDALFFNSFLIHRSGTNQTNDKIRISMHFRYNDLKEPSFIKRKFPRQRIDKYKEEILLPGFPSEKEMNEFLHLQCQ